MKIIVVGATGAVGSAAVKALADRHEIVTVGRSSGDIRCDIDSVDNIRSMYEQIGNIDAVISATGQVHFGPIDTTTTDEFMLGINSKVMGQVNLVLEGIRYVNDGGSFTITCGVTNRDPIHTGTSAAAANGALDGFVIGAAVDMPRGIRINAVSPEVLESCRETYGPYFPGHRPVSDEEVGLAYCKSVEGCLSGEIIIVE